MKAEEKKIIILVSSNLFTAVHKFLFVSDLMAPAKVWIAQIHRASEVQFTGDTDASSTHLNHRQIPFKKLGIPGER